MAGDWIKMRTDLYRDPKVSVMADILMDDEGDLAAYVDQHCQRNMTVTRNVTRNACVGALLSVWGVMRHRGVRIGDDLVCMGVGLWVLDDIADMPGFGNAMESTGWVQENDQGLIFPRFFDEYNVEPDGKNKSKNAERQARYRERKRTPATPESNVTSNVTGNVTVTPREEESRVEKSIEVTKVTSCPKPAKADPGPLADHGFTLSNGNLWRPTVAKIHEWQATFPVMDLDAQLRLAGQWLKDNPAKRKTEKGMHRFLFAWLERAQNNNKALPLFQPNQTPKRPDPYANCPRYS
jgi:hypothetical protein